MWLITPLRCSLIHAAVSGWGKYSHSPCHADNKLSRYDVLIECPWGIDTRASSQQEEDGSIQKKLREKAWEKHERTTKT